MYVENRRTARENAAKGVKPRTLREIIVSMPRHALEALLSTVSHHHHHDGEKEAQKQPSGRYPFMPDAAAPARAEESRVAA